MPTPFVELGIAIQQLLAFGTPLVGDRVWRGRRRPLKTGTPNAIVVSLKASRGTRADVAHGPMDWLTAYTIDCMSRVEAGQIPEDVIDPILSEAFERLAGVGASLLQGVEDVLPDPEIEWDTEESTETPLVVATFVVRIRHRTQASALVAWN